MDDSIIEWFHNEHKLDIGSRTAEQIKCSIGAGVMDNKQQVMVKGRDMVTGIPKTITVPADEIRKALSDTLFQIISAIKKALESTPPELSSDILDRGIILTGGGSLLRGLDDILREETNLPVHVSEDPLKVVVQGTGIVMENPKKFAAVLL